MKITLTEVPPGRRDAAARPPAHVAIFGASTGGIRTWEALASRDDVHVVAFLDNDERRRERPLHGLPVISPGALDPAEVDAIVVGSMHVDAITRQLVDLGFPRARIQTLASLGAAAGPPDRRPALPPGSRPVAMNFQVNDICNSRCVMCSIWQKKRDVELSPAEFGELLSDPYFSELQYVGITGGEPTLRRDLAEYYTVVADRCTKLRAASFITHGLDTDRAVAAYRAVAVEYRARGLGFTGMVSIDGVGEVHDTIRGRKGAFERATRTLFALNAAGAPTIACCTVVRGNVWGLRDLLDWSRGRTYVRFRVAEFIRRLDNDGRGDQIRSFDEAERSELISFFEHLIASYEPEEAIRRTYRSIVTMLAGGGRLVGCPYAAGEALSVDCRGNFAVCAPKGLPHPLGPDAAEAVGAAVGERREIVVRHCASCIHDCHSEWRPDVAQTLAVAAAVQERLALEETPSPRGPGAPRPTSGLPKKVLVLGWYGTETIGDLAILAGIVGDYRRSAPGVQFVVPSQYPAYTRHNLARMSLTCEVASYGDAELVGDLWNCDTVIFGGGPLMDVPQLAWMAGIFERARVRGCRTIVEGCGVGPVNRPETAEAIRRIVDASDEIRLRDAGSAVLLASLTGRRDVEVADDPGARWVRSTGVKHSGDPSGPICVFARELTAEYPQALTPEDATAELTAFLRRLCDWYPAHRIQLHAMHHFPIGGDDRQYARRLAAAVARPNLSVDDIPRTPRETVEIMSGASFVVSMRFHSLVFADSIGAPLLAIDYTQGGKIAHYTRERGLEDRTVGLGELSTLEPDRLAALGLPRAVMPAAQVART